MIKPTWIIQKDFLPEETEKLISALESNESKYIVTEGKINLSSVEIGSTVILRGSIEFVRNMYKWYYYILDMPKFNFRDYDFTKNSSDMSLNCDYVLIPWGNLKYREKYYLMDLILIAYLLDLIVVKSCCLEPQLVKNILDKSLI